jgi:hypothetical protein
MEDTSHILEDKDWIELELFADSKLRNSKNPDISNRNEITSKDSIDITKIHEGIQLETGNLLPNQDTLQEIQNRHKKENQLQKWKEKKLLKRI